MPTLQLVVVTVRLLAIVLLIRVGQSVLELMTRESDGPVPSSEFTVIWVSMVFVPAVIAVLLWLFPLTLSKKKWLSAGATDDGMESTQSIEKLHIAGVSVVGLWVLSTALPDTLYWLMSWWRSARSQLSSHQLTADQKASLVSSILQTAIGAWLVLGPHGVVGALRRLRAAGAPAAGEPSDS